LPARMAKVGGSPRWVVVKVDYSLDWRKELNGASLRLGTTAALRLAGNSSLGSFVDTTNEPHQLLPLKPKDEGSAKLVPSGRVEVVVRVGEDLLRESPAMDENPDDGEVIAVKPLAPDLTGAVAPLVYWKPGPIGTDSEALAALQFKCHDYFGPKKGRKLEGKFADAPRMRVVGGRTKWPEGPRKLRHLLGLVGAKKLYLSEVEFYPVDRDREFGRTPELESQPKPLEEEDDAVRRQMRTDEFHAKRKANIAAYGTAKKRRLQASAEGKRVDDDKVMDLDDTLADLRSKALKTKVVSARDQELQVRRDVLPKFDLEAKDPAQLYAEGVAAIAPASLLKHEAAALAGDGGGDLEKVLQSAPKTVQGMSVDGLVRHCRTSTAAAVVACRAAADLQEGPSSADGLARKLRVLNHLVKLHQSAKKKGDAHIKELEKYLGIGAESRLLQLWYNTYYEATANGALRRIKVMKLRCHLIVYALHLTPNLRLDFKPLQDELGLDLDTMQKALRFVGCRVSLEKDSNGLAGARVMASLHAPLRLDADSGGNFKRKR